MAKYIVYHGTNQRFKKFDLYQTAMGVAWFSDNLDLIKNGESGAVSSKIILKCEVTINNPAGWDEYDKYSFGELVSMKYDGVILEVAEGVKNYIIFKASQAKILGETSSLQEQLQVMAHQAKKLGIPNFLKEHDDEDWNDNGANDFENDEEAQREMELTSNEWVDAALIRAGENPGMVNIGYLLTAIQTFVHDYNDDTDKIHSLRYLITHLYPVAERNFTPRRAMRAEVANLYDAFVYFEEYGDDATINVNPEDGGKAIQKAMSGSDDSTQADMADIKPVDAEKLDKLTHIAPERLNEQLGKIKNLVKKLF